jgi:hypothetical protein
MLPPQDVRQLWRRLVFNLLITNVDDHLQNHGFLHVAHGLWRLAPAFDINPFPDKDRESKTWLSEQDGPITDVQMLLARAVLRAGRSTGPGRAGRSACRGGELAAGRTQPGSGVAAGRAG